MVDWSKDPEVIELRDAMISVGRLEPDADMVAMNAATAKLLLDFVNVAAGIGRPPPPKPARMSPVDYSVLIAEMAIETWIGTVKAEGRDPLRLDTTH